MKAYIYNDDKGEDISIVDIPEEMKDDAELYRSELVEKICELDDDLMMQYLEGEEPSVEDMKKVLRKATCECAGHSGMLRFRLQKQRRSEASGCGPRVYAVLRTDIPAIKGVDLDGNEIERHSSDEEPFCCSCIQDHDRPVRWKAGIFPRIFRNHELRFLCAKCNEGQERACWPYPSDACQQETGA